MNPTPKNPIEDKEDVEFECESDEDEEMLIADFEKIEQQLEEVDPKIYDEDDIDPSDKAAYQVPATDEGFLEILKERFGHDSFKEG